MTAAGAREITRVLLTRLGLSTPDHVPLVADDEATEPPALRDAADVRGRAHALAALSALAEGADPRRVAKVAEERALARWLGEAEREALARGTRRVMRRAPELPEPAVAEELWALVWALGGVAHLDAEKPATAPAKAFEALPEDAALRDGGDLLEALDLYRCLQWHLDEADLRDLSLPAPLKPFVIVGRNAALVWLTAPQPPSSKR